MVTVKFRDFHTVQYSLSRIFPSNQMYLNQVAIHFNFTNFSVKSKANEVVVFIFTNFSVKTTANEVAVFTFTNFSVKSNPNQVAVFNFTNSSNMFEVPYPVLALEHLWLPGYGL